MRYTPFSRYRASEVDWLGELPAHWKVQRLSYVVDCLDGVRIPLNGEERSYRQGQFPYWGANGIVDYVDDWLFDEPLVLLGEDGAPFLDPNASVASFVDGKIWVNNHAHVLRPRSPIDGRFLTYALNQTRYAAFIDGSTRDKLTQGQMNAIPVPCPPSPEQRAIANFLDSQTAKLDTLIAKKRALIEKLKEKRAALISRTVTRGLPPDAARAAGLDPNPPLKPSGVEWIGDVPEHWSKPQKLSRLVDARRNSLVNGPFGSDLLTSEFTGDGVPVVYIRDISGGAYRRRSDVHVTPEKAKQLDFCRVDPGDVLVAKVGDPPGAAAVYPEGEPPAIVTQDVIRIRVDRSRVAPVFLAYYLNSASGRGLIDDIAIESTRMRVSLDDYRSGMCPLPPLEEQRAVAGYLDQEVAKMDQLSSNVQLAIERLQEYRTALITAAITGKIDVREGAWPSEPV